MFWTQLETSLGAVARIRQFEKETVAEDLENETHDPPFDWPSQGSIEIKNLSAKYKWVSSYPNRPCPMLITSAEMMPRE
jgi:ATP-binding cassette subfamily C (CFTR/MRP) protein 1